MKAEQQVPRNALVWIIITQFSLVALHIQRVPIWVLAVYVIAAWRILNVMMLGRHCPDLPCDISLTEAEWKSAWQVRRQTPPPESPPALGEMISILSSLGGHLGRKCDGLPGPKSIWIGLHRTMEFALARNAFGPGADTGEA